MTKNEQIVENNSVKLWVETMGDIQNPAVVLIAGAGAHARFWSDALCETLAKAGYFVIRFDHRDTGLSSAIDYEKSPYTVKELAGDVLAILDHFQIRQAHVVGHSMGGTIAQLLAIHHPDRIRSYTSMSVSTVGGNTTQPSDEVMAVLLENKPTQNFEESLNGFMRSWEILNGNVPLDSNMAKEYTRELYDRSNHEVGVAWNHIHAQENVGDLSSDLAELKTPGLFIHGENDPLIPLQGGINTAKAASNSTLEIIPDMGHMIFSADLQKNIAAILVKHFSESKEASHE